MQPIAALDHTEYAAEESAFPTPESVREQPARDWDQIMAFQGCVAALDDWPLDVPMTGWDIRLISQRCQYDAQTDYLNRLADSSQSRAVRE
jgi:hypothetical protein